jgi:hypothetical protein
MQQFTDLFSDWIWNLGFHNAALGHLAAATVNSPIFLYYYDHPGQFSLGELVTAIGGQFHPVVEILRTKGSNWFKTAILRKKLPNYGKISVNLQSAYCNL